MSLSKPTIVVLFFVILLSPMVKAEASIFTKISGFFVANAEQNEIPQENSQTMAILQANTGSAQAELVVEHDALAVSPEINQKQSPLISTYVVHKGDTLSTIAKMFDVSVNTVLWSNNLTKKDTLKEGQMLVILPVTGVSHTIKKGDTLQSLAKKYKADISEIESFNGLSDNPELAIGDTLIIPDGEIAATPTKSGSTSGSSGSIHIGGAFGALKPITGKEKSSSGYFIRPVVTAVRTQGLHGYNGIDLASSVGTPIRAAAGGTVIVSRNSGYNGGYGEYVVISHPNGMQTLYGHMSSVLVGVGDTVEQGQTIGKMGRTGKATGSHLHFEVRGGTNPF